MATNGHCPVMLAVNIEENPLQISEILNISGALLGSLGGAAVIIFGFSSWLGKVWANRFMEREKAEYARELESLRNSLTQGIESHKFKLKISEFIFERQFQAASEFVSLRHNIISVPFIHPEMDWEEACALIAYDFEQIEKQLDSYISKHGAVLEKEVINLIYNASNEAGTGKFEVSKDRDYYSDKASAAASKLCDRLAEAEEKMLKQVYSQINA